MENLMVIATTILYLLSAIGYVVYTLRRRNDPVPATWILMLMVFGLSNWMYWHSPVHSFAGNIANTLGLVNVLMIFAGVVIRNIRDNTWRLALSKFQIGCLLAGGLIYLFWLLANDAVIAYCLTQLVGLIAYLATAQRLWKAKKTTEPYFLWVAALLACLAAIYPAVVKQDLLAGIYLLRAIPSTIVILFLIRRLKRMEAN